MNSILDFMTLNAQQMEWINIAAHIIGFIGMGCVVLAFWCVVSERWKPTSLAYNILNGIGAILLILSLCVHFNLGSFVIEIFWITISGIGIYKSFRQPKMA